MIWSNKDRALVKLLLGGCCIDLEGPRTLSTIYFHLMPSFFLLELISDIVSFSCKEPSVKGLQEVATRVFTRNSQASQDAAESKKQSSVQLVDNPNLSPLARFLLSRSVSKFSCNCFFLLFKTSSF